MDASDFPGARIEPALLAEYVRILRENGIARARIGDVEIEFSRDAATPAAREGSMITRPRPSGYDALLPDKPGFPRQR